ncbi:hypothetical protein NKH18_48070 [Streptomyces sp. M10(2022)]
MCCLLAVQGVGFADLSPTALLHHAHASRTAKAVLRPGKKDANVFAGHAAWNVLHAMGHFAPSTPATLRQALHRGQLTLEELVDRHTIRNQSVRRLLLDYFHHRKSDTDYASLVNLVRNVAHHFWARIEEINPGQADLNIPADLYSAWRRQIGVRHDGKPRIGVDTIVIAVRSFYYDLHTWAADEPERWAPGSPLALSRPANYAGWPSAAAGSTSGPPTAPVCANHSYRSSSDTSRSATTTPVPCWNTPQQPPPTRPSPTEAAPTAAS